MLRPRRDWPKRALFARVLVIAVFRTQRLRSLRVGGARAESSTSRSGGEKADRRRDEQRGPARATVTLRTGRRETAAAIRAMRASSPGRRAPVLSKSAPIWRDRRHDAQLARWCGRLARSDADKRPRRSRAIMSPLHSVAVSFIGPQDVGQSLVAAEAAPQCLLAQSEPAPHGIRRGRRSRRDRVDGVAEHEVQCESLGN